MFGFKKGQDFLIISKGNKQTGPLCRKEIEDVFEIFLSKLDSIAMGLTSRKILTCNYPIALAFELTILSHIHPFWFICIIYYYLTN